MAQQPFFILSFKTCHDWFFCTKEISEEQVESAIRVS